MKKTILTCLLLSTMVFAGCDKIEGPYSVSQQSGQVNDTLAVIRKVLLEDFTGHKCQGCPEAHETAETLKAFFRDSLIIITVHAGFYATTNASGSFTYDFTTDPGDELLATLLTGQAFFPIGTVNRKKYGNSFAVSYGDWSAKVAETLKLPPQAQLEVIPTWNDASRTISASVKTKFVTAISGDIGLSVYYVEDSIVNWQAFPLPAGNVSSYVHRHVLRGALNNTWGSVIAANASAGDSVITSVTGSPIANDIVTGRVSIVAVLFNNVSKEVIQAEEVKLMP